MNRQAEERILSACGRIITESGSVGISIEKLYVQPEMADIDHSLFTQNEEIFNMIFLHFEKESDIRIPFPDCAALQIHIF